MDTTNLQHFKQAVNDDWARIADGARSCLQFDVLFVIAIFAESRKCRMDEGYDKLLRNAARSMVAEYRRRFDAHFREAVGFFYWEQKDYETLAVEVEQEVPRLRRYIERWLCSYRQELVCSRGNQAYLSPYAEVIRHGKCEDHPMKTFHFWLDYLDQMKIVEDFDTWFYLKRNIIDLARVGTAVIPRTEWEPRVTVLPSFFEQVQS